MIELGTFEVGGLTFDYSTWKESHRKDIEDENIIFDKECKDFAKKQKVYMLNKMANFDKTRYFMRAINIKPEKLEYFSNSGPLYQIFKILVDDTSKEKSVERIYTDYNSFSLKYGFWYPQKEQIILRLGVKQ